MRRLALEVLEQRRVLSVTPFPLPLPVAGRPDSSAGFDDFGGLDDFGGHEAKGSFVVSTPVDENDGDFSPGDLSLREALSLADGQGGDDVIRFDDGLTGSTITLRLGQLDIGSNVAIEGPGAEQLTIDAAGNSRVFNIGHGVVASISGLTITGGGGVEEGGGVYNAGTLTIAESSVSGNSAFAQIGGVSRVEARGGGVFNSSTLTINQSNLADNSVFAQGGDVRVYALGGGVFNSGTLAIANCTVSSNTSAARSSDESAYPMGGGIHNDGGTVTITGATISDNSALADAPLRWADANGGGINNDNGVMTITNTTISGNSASTGPSIPRYGFAHGGGIFADGGTLTITNAAVFGNSAFADFDPSGYAYAQGGGVHSMRHGTTRMCNTIVAGNHAVTDHKDVIGVYEESSHNLIGVIDGSQGLDGDGALYGTVGSPLDPRLGPLGDFGGPTPTHALLPDSPAIDAGSNHRAVQAGLIHDQRGFDRFVDGDGDRTATVDVGPYEYGSWNPWVVSTADDENDGDYGPGDLSLREALALAAEQPGDDVILFDGGLLGGSVTLDPALGPLDVDNNVDILGLGAGRLAIDAAAGGRVFDVFGGVHATICDLTVTGGSSGGNGGGIRNAGTLALSRVMVSGNAADVEGGGIYNTGTLAMADSTVSENSAGSGGGIQNFGELTLANSTIWRNSAQDSHGGGITNGQGTLALANVTICGNVAESSGGGIAHRTGTATLHNTITAGNSLRDGSADDVAGGFDPAGSYNLIGVIDGSTGLDGTGTLYGTAGSPLDAMLGSLADNGGPTLTVALLSGSPALERGSNTRATEAGLTHDQRGFQRFFDAEGDGTATVDVGAWEFQIDQVAPEATLMFAPNIAHPAVTGQTMSVEFTDMVGMDLSTFDDSDVRVTGPGGYQESARLISVDDPGAGTRCTVAYQVPAAGGVWDRLDNGTYQVWLQAEQVADTSGNFVPAGLLGSFAVAIADVQPESEPFQPVQPLGSWIYEFSADVQIALPGEAELLAFELDDGQTVTVVADPNPTLQPTIELLDPSDSLLGSATAAAAGEDVVLQTITTTGAGKYTLVVGGALGSTGMADVRLVLGAAIEEEEQDGPANDDPASAQELDADFVDVGFVDAGGGPAQRAAVLGIMNSEADWYRLTLGDGQSTTLALAAEAPGGSTLVLYDSGMELLAMGSEASYIDWAIEDFVDASTDAQPGAYFVRVTGDSGTDYALVITRDSGFDLEPNNRPAVDAQDLSPSGSALGHLGFDGDEPPLYQRLTASDERGGYDEFGRSVAISGDTMIVGAHGRSAWPTLADYGVAYIFHFDGDGWVGRQRLESPSPVFWGHFGYSVSIDGQFAIVGERADEGTAGSAHVFHFDGAEWIWQQELVPPGGAVGDRFGHSVSISGQTAIVASKPRGFQVTGRAYVFRFDGQQWNPEQELVPTGPYRERFAEKVAISGDTALVAAPGSNLVFAYHFNGSQWIQQQSLIPSEPLWHAANFGDAIAIDANVAVVGARRDGSVEQGEGSAYVFRHDGNSWAVEQKIFTDDPSPGQNFGQAVSVDGETIVIGAHTWSGPGDVPGSVHVFQFEAGAWREKLKLTTPSTNDGDDFGYAVGISDQTVAIGAYGDDDDDGGGRAGAAYALALQPPFDDYAVSVRTGDLLSVATATPGDAPGQFVNSLDPAVELYDPAGNLVAEDDNGAQDARNARLTHTATGHGSYTVRVQSADLANQGEYALQVTGHSGPLPAFEVVTTDPADGTIMPLAPQHVTVQLSDAVLVTSLDASDLTIDGVPAAGFTLEDATTVVFQLPSLWPGYRELAIAAGAILDLQGTPIEPVVFQIGSGFFPTPLSPVGPPGGLIYQSSLSHQILTGDGFDGFVIDLDAGQTLTAVVDPGQTLQPTIEVLDPNHNSIGFTAAGAPGQDAVLQTVAVVEPGTYTVLVKSALNTTGPFALCLTLGAAVQEAAHDGPANTDPASAQDLDASFTTLDGGLAQRGALLGTRAWTPGDVIDGEDFESGALGGRWTTYSSLPDGRIRISGEHGTGGGSFAMLMDHELYGADRNLNEAIWTVDLSGQTEAMLSFMHADWQDEAHLFSGDFTGHRDADGVAISDDGVRWHPVWNPPNSQPVDAWTPYAVDLIAEAAAAGMALGPELRIKFQQYDNLPIEQGDRSDWSRDGRGYDEIMISVPPALEGDWYRFTLEDGQSATLALAAISPGRLRLGLYDHAQTLLATGEEANDLNQVIHHFVDTTIDGRPDTYYARVSRPGGDYSLIVTRNAAFAAEPNSTLDDAQPLAPAAVALGYLQYPLSLPKSPEFRVQGPEHSTLDAGPSTLDYVPGRLIVRFADAKTDPAGAEIVRASGAKVIRRLPIIDGAVIELSSGTADNAAKADVLQAAAQWSAHPSVLYAEPDYVFRCDTIANDPMFPELWGLHNTGRSGAVPGVADADIDAPEAWDVLTGSSDVVVAVIDTGVDYTHEDLAANMWVNPGETPGDGIDNDGNGYIDDVFGIDAAYHDSDPFDGNGHGTHTAGTIGAVGNNGIGVTGVNWNVRIMALKYLDDDGGGTGGGAIACLDYITMMKTTYGVNVVASNNSYGGSFPSQAVKDAIQASNEAGIMFVASAGNTGTNNDQNPHYPSDYDLPGIISVAATYPDDHIAGFSNYGISSVDLGAPGYDVLSTVPGNQYELMSGTSMAAPHVTGAVAMMASQYPEATPAEIKQALLYGADPVPDLWGRTVSGGRLNLAHALAGRMGDRGDYYQVEIRAGDALLFATSTPGDGPGQFDNPVDPAIELYDPNGVLVAEDDNGAADRRNAQLAYEAAVGGTYTVHVFSTTDRGEYVLTVVAQGPAVAGRHVFYNNSAFDGKDSAANAEDDRAIATDKEALLPGRTATFANYTSYSGGINGIMVDVFGLPEGVAPTAGDFQFRVGNNDLPGGWPLAPAETSITVRPGDGINGSDRVTIVWPDNAIDKQWLQVAVLPTAYTGLEEADVFYFGNAVGECGDSTTDAKVNTVDMLAARDNQRSFLDRAPIDFFVDFNRDQKVNATDMLIALNNPTHFLNALRLITVPSTKAAAEDARGIRQEPAHDAVLRRTSGSSEDQKAPLAKLDWLYEYEPGTVTHRPLEGRDSAATGLPVPHLKYF